MMADQLFRSIATEGKRVPTWDVESILTRAVYRALSNNSQIPQALDPSPANLDKWLPTSDTQLQLKLVAEKLCKRVERRYERKLQQQRERDRTETARKLGDIRAEYSEQLDAKRRELERERLRLVDEFAERERALRHKIELQLAEKESALEISRRSLETRLAELTLNKEHLDRIKTEFHAKFASDVEKLNQEWERLGAKREELKALFKGEFEQEQLKLKGKVAEMEKENDALRRRISEDGTEVYELRSRLARCITLEEDIRLVNERLHKQIEENHQLSQYKYEVEHFKEENLLLKQELEQMRRASHALVAPTLSKEVAKEQELVAYRMKIKEMKNVLGVMNDKIMSLTSERDYLRDMLRAVRKDFFRDGAPRSGQYYFGRASDSMKNRKLRDMDGSEDTSISSSTLSECSSELRNIKERFATLENLAKTLDTTVDCVTAARSMTENQIERSPASSISGNYDDFCRSMKNGAKLYSSPLKNAAKESLKRNSIDLSIAVPTQPATSVEQELEEDETRGKFLSNGANGASISIDHAAVFEKAEETAPAVADEQTCDHLAPSTSFAERLKARNDATRKLKFSAVKEKKDGEAALATQSSDATNLALDSYMALFAQRTIEEQISDVSTGIQEVRGDILKCQIVKGFAERSTGKQEHSADDKLQFEVEDVLVDKPASSESEIDW